VRCNDVRLRNLGIYQLPDGREVIADLLYRDGATLYSARGWEAYGLAEFRVGHDGRLLSGGRPTPWNVEHLRDTGREAAYPTTRRILQKVL
jgi:hypothetical protein